MSNHSHTHARTHTALLIIRTHARMPPACPHARTHSMQHVSSFTQHATSLYSSDNTTTSPLKYNAVFGSMTWNRVISQTRYIQCVARCVASGNQLSVSIIVSLTQLKSHRKPGESQVVPPGCVYLRVDMHDVCDM